MAELTVGSLFSGIGGLDLGLERAGMRVIWQSEIDPYACKVLAKHWPEVVNHGNIKEINWQEVERPDIICGGYPCQPFSTAGKRRGEEDPRHLWPWVREAISQLRPRYAILENVRGHLSMGGLSVIGELASIGYDAEWRVVSAASVGANHRRDRVIIVAYPKGKRCETGGQSKRTQSAHAVSTCGCQHVANANRIGLEGQGAEQQTTGTARGSKNTGQLVANPDNSRHLYPEKSLESNIGGCSTGEHISDTNTRENGWRDGSLQQSARTVYSGADNGRGAQIYAGWQWWEIEPDVGRVAHGIPSRVDRLRGLGNAVVPQVAEVIGRLVVAHANQ